RPASAPCAHQTSECSTAGSTRSPRRNGRGWCRTRVPGRNSRAPGEVRARQGLVRRATGGSPDRGWVTLESLLLLDVLDPVLDRLWVLSTTPRRLSNGRSRPGGDPRRAR